VTDKFEFIDAEYAAYQESYDAHVPSIVKMCRWMEVSRSGFYEWRNAPESATAKRRGILALYVQKSFEDSDDTYGYRRVHADLVAWGSLLPAALRPTSGYRSSQRMAWDEHRIIVEKCTCPHVTQMAARRAATPPPTRTSCEPVRQLCPGAGTGSASSYAPPPRRSWPGRASRRSKRCGSQKWEPTWSAAVSRSTTRSDSSRRPSAPRSTQSDGDRHSGIP
jgi:hypothetical protein